MSAAPATVVPGTSGPVVAARHLSKVYRLGEQEVHALRDVSFEIGRGELVAIMGPSGSGKSTLMNLIGALDTPTDGELRIDGSDVSKLSPDQLAALRNRTIGFVFQSFNLLARTSALNNVLLPLSYAHPRLADAHAIATARLTDVGLAQRMDHIPSQLSGGQQQRVAIARALVNSPSIILADEPTGALDSQTSEEILALFQKLNAEGLTIIIVTHEADIAAHCRRLLRVRDGQLIEDRRR